jgi:TPR repeat protein
MKKIPTAAWIASVLLLLLAAALFFNHKRSPTREASPTAASDIADPALHAEATDGASTNAVPKVVHKKAYSLRGSVDAPPGDAAQVIERLRPLAESGDGRAALEIYVKLQNCFRAQGSVTDADIKVYERIGVSAQALAATQQKIQSECASAQSALKDRGKWLEMAAASGDEHAQLVYSGNPGAVLGDATEMIRDPDKIKRYKEVARSYLTNLASKGNTSALMALAGEYQGGVLYPKDPVRAYAYYRAVELAKPGTIPKQLLDYQAKEVPYDRLSEAEALAKRIYGDCCAN